MRRDTIMRYLTAIALTLVLAACGGGGSAPAAEDNSTTPDNNTTKPDNNTTKPDSNTTKPPAKPNAQGKGLVVCSGADQGFGLATVLEVGKHVKGLKNNPNIRLWHLSDGTRKACVIEGSVEVLL